MRAEDGDGFARLHDERLVVLEPVQGRDDGVEGGPAARRAARAAVDDEVVRTFGDVGIEVVHQHAERGFLRPSLAGDRRASRRADMAAEGAHRAEVVCDAFPRGKRTQSIAIVAGCRAEGSNLRTYARVVNLKLKNFLLDFQRDCGEQRSIRDERRNRFDVGRRRTIDGERRHDRAHACVHARERRRRRERREQIDRLARAEDLDGDDARRERRARCGALSAAPMLMLTWSSRLAEVGIVSTLAGCASVLISDVSAAAVTCAIM